MASFAAQPQLDRYYSSNPSLLSNRSGTYRAPTVPPLRSAAALGRQQTLGPVFSDEEDGDDTEYIAARMRELQLGQLQSNSNAAHINQLRQQQQTLQLQQQYLLQQLLGSQSQSGTRGQPGSQEASMAHFQQLQLQQMHMAHLRQQVDPQLQAQLLSKLQAQPYDVRAQALAAQAQLQAQVHARAQKQKEEMKARFEAKPNPLPIVSPTKPSSPQESPSKASAPLGRFAQARQTSSSPFGELTALLARRSETQPVKAEEPTAAPTMSEDRLAARTALQSLGHGRPSSTSNQNRAKSNPFPMPYATKTDTCNRSISLAQPLKPIRQPFGPPAPTNELGERNFQSMARKAAGKNLGMLGRRGAGSGETSPVV